MALGAVVRVADVPGVEMRRIKGTPRSEARIARAWAFYRDRVAVAATVGDVQASAFDLYRGAVAHAEPDLQRLMTDRFTAFVEDAVAAMTKGR